MPRSKTTKASTATRKPSAKSSPAKKPAKAAADKPAPKRVRRTDNYKRPHIGDLKAEIAKKEAEAETATQALKVNREELTATRAELKESRALAENRRTSIESLLKRPAQVKREVKVNPVLVFALIVAIIVAVVK